MFPSRIKCVHRYFSLSNKKIENISKKYVIGSETTNVSGERHMEIDKEIDGSDLLKDVDGWNEKSSSDSEAIVKAIKHSKDETFIELQNSTVEIFVNSSKDKK